MPSSTPTTPETKELQTHVPTLESVLQRYEELALSLNPSDQEIVTPAVEKLLALFQTLLQEAQTRAQLRKQYGFSEKDYISLERDPTTDKNELGMMFGERQKTWEEILRHDSRIAACIRDIRTQMRAPLPSIAHANDQNLDDIPQRASNPVSLLQTIKTMQTALQTHNIIIK